MTNRDRRQYVLECAYNIVVTHIPSHTLRQAWLKSCGTNLGATVSVCRGCTLQGAEKVTIGDGSVVGWRCHLDGRGGLRIGRNVTIGPDVHLLTADHDPNDPDFAQRNAPIAIGDQAWLATRCMVLRGTSIGQGAIVAAGAVVCHDVEDFNIVAGVPARQTGTRPRGLRYKRTFRQLFY